MSLSEHGAPAAIVASSLGLSRKVRAHPSLDGLTLELFRTRPPALSRGSSRPRLHPPGMAPFAELGVDDALADPRGDARQWQRVNPPPSERTDRDDPGDAIDLDRRDLRAAGEIERSRHPKASLHGGLFGAAPRCSSSRDTASDVAPSSVDSPRDAAKLVPLPFVSSTGASVTASLPVRRFPRAERSPRRFAERRHDDTSRPSAPASTRR